MPSGEPYYVPIHHTVLTGMTTSGKTTAAERILRNHKGKSLVFLTKRGEKTFQDAPLIPPFYQERFDWEYVRSLLEATMKEKLKFETPWIIRIAKQTQIELKAQGLDSDHLTPGEALQITNKLLSSAIANEKMREFDKNQYMLLHAYLGKVLPTLLAAKMKFSDTLDLKAGLNVMDLTEWYLQEEVQMLCMRASMENLLQKGSDTISALPEAWKIIPQERNTPVKLLFEKYIREGATNNNYLMVDAQDLRGVDKTHLGQCYIWIIGKMIEANEVERLLKQTLSTGVKAETIQKLPLGHFLVVNGLENTIDQVYVWPWTAPEEMVKAVAKGYESPDTVKNWLLERRQDLNHEAQARMEANKFGEWMKNIEARIQALTNRADQASTQFTMHLQKIDDQIKQLQNSPAGHLQSGNMTLEQVTSNISITATERDYKLTTENAGGKIMWLAKEHFLNEWRSQTDIERQLTEKHGWSMPRITLYKALEKLVEDSYLGKLDGRPAKYRLAEFVKIAES